jgi:hypothetical protein
MKMEIIYILGTIGLLSLILSFVLLCSNIYFAILFLVAGMALMYYALGKADALEIIEGRKK